MTCPLEASVGPLREVLVDSAPGCGAGYIMPGLARDTRHERMRTSVMTSATVHPPRVSCTAATYSC